MRRLPLLPHALVSIAIVVASTVVLGVSLARDGVSRIGAAPASARATDLTSRSPTARLAYWREATSGEALLWVSDLDGSRRWTIAAAADLAKVSLTRWSTDGSSVGYVEDGSALVVVRLAGRRSVFPIPADARSEKRRIVGYHWSPSGTRIAASLRTTEGHGKDSDIFVLDVRGGAPWRRITTMGDAFAGPWIDEERVLFDTLLHMVGVAGVAEADDVRPLTAMSGASPMLGEDGRIYFAGGIGGSIELREGPYAYGWIWSTSLDGGDLRRETMTYQDALRLQARWPDGRFAVGMPGAVRLMGDALEPLPYDAGSILRVHVLPDRKSALGFTETRVVRIDLSRPPPATDAAGATHPSLTVLLDGVKQADAWSPERPVVLASASGRSDAGPRSRLAFSLGGSAWLEEPDGRIRRLLTRASSQEWLSHPIWSPEGDRLAIAVSDGAWQWRTRARIQLLDRNGDVLRTINGLPPMSWAPDGRALAYARPSDEPEVVIADRDGRVLMTLEGSLAAWTDRGLVVRGAGEQYRNTGWRIGQPIELVSGASRRTITTTERLAQHPLVALEAGGDLVTVIGTITPAPDGELIAVSLMRIDQQRQAPAGVLAVIRASDGEPVVAVANDPRIGIHSLIWAPRGPLVGHTIEAEYTAPPHLRDAGRAVVRDARSWAAMAEAEGRFAGWSPDGDWWYAARRDGLYAYRLDGSGGFRVSPYGVSVSATRP